MKNGMIPNLKMGEVYDQRYADAEIHYEALSKLALFFGMQMPAHRHDRFFQIHFLTKGTVRIFLDDVKYVCQAPVFFFTPPSVAHSFITDPNCEGHVLTVQQNIIWSLLEDGFQIQNFIPICLQRNNLEPMLQQSMDQIERYLYQLKLEFEANQDGKDLALKSLINLIFLNVLRLSNAAPLRVKNCKNELSIFRQFNELIEDHFMEHWSLAQYASHLAITEARLNEICKRLADISSKKLIFDRQMQEAKRLLIFTDDSINEICYQLGFKDPAYFSRFFQRHAGIRPSDFRNQHIQQ